MLEAAGLLVTFVAQRETSYLIGEISGGQVFEWELELLDSIVQGDFDGDERVGSDTGGVGGHDREGTRLMTG